MSDTDVYPTETGAARDVGPAADRSPRTRPLFVEALGMGYGDVEVLRDVNLCLEPGESVRVTGSNGAGKSTLLRGITGIQPYASGSVVVAGEDLLSRPVEAKRHIGYSSGEVPFPYLTGREHLRLVQRVHKLQERSIVDIIGCFPSWAVVRDLDKTARTFSHGMRQQLAFLMALLHDPVLLVLDEAVDGFDEASLDEAEHHLATRSGMGRAVVYVAHRDEVAAKFPRAREIRVTPAGP